MTPLPRADPPGTVPPLRPEHTASLEYGGMPEHPPPMPNFGGLVKQSLTKKARTDLARRMVAMCTLTGWQGTTLNPDMADQDKLAILTARFGRLVTQDDPDELYAELLDISAVAMGWAQGLTRRQKRDHRRAAKAAKRAAKKTAKQEPKKGKGE
jgi:hypothetical protein